MVCVSWADCDAIALVGQSKVGLTARPRKRNFPHSCGMNVLPFLSSKGAVDSIVAYCLRTTYLIGGRGRERDVGHVGNCVEIV